MHISLIKQRRCVLPTKVSVFSIACFLILSTGAIKASEILWQTLIDEGDNDIKQQKLVQAEDCYRKALKEIHHTSHSNDDMVKCLERLASALALENKTDEALPLYYKSLHLLEQTDGKNSRKVVPTLFVLGSIFESEGDPKIAMRFYRRALAINEKNYGPYSPAVAESLHHLGHANFAAGQNKEAEKNYKSSLAILMQQPSLSDSEKLESLLGDYNDLLRKNDNSSKDLISDFQTEILKDRLGFPVPTTGVPTSTWQKEMSAMSNITKAEQNNEEQKVMLRGFKQPLSSTTLAPAYQTMSDVLYNQHPYAQGEDYYQRMIAIDIKALGPYHPSVADDLVGLASLYISQHRYGEAEPLLIKALSTYQRVYGSDNLLVTKTKSYLALVYEKLGDNRKAVALYGEAFETGHMVLQPNTLETARMLNELGFLYYKQGRLEDAITTYQWALSSTKGAVGDQNILVAACLIDYANVLRSLGRITEACEMDEQARRIRYANFDDIARIKSYHD